MKIRKILTACFSLLCLFAIVAGTIGFTNEPVKKTKSNNKPKPSSNTT